jgi:hypothetical protein
MIIPSVSDLIIWDNYSELFRVYNTQDGAVKLKGFGVDMLGFNSGQGKTYALGTWSFSSATIEGFTCKFA